MKLFKLTNKTKSDLKQITIFTERRWGRDQRNHYLNQFDDAFYLLADVPSAGMEFSYIKKGHRIFLQGSHVKFYKAGSECKI